MADTIQLKAQRGRVKGSLTRLKTFSENIPPEKSVEEIAARLEKLTELWDEFKEIDDQLVINGLDSEFEDFEDRYYEVKALLTKGMRARLPVQSTASNGSPANASAVNVSADHVSAEQISSTMNRLFEQQRSFYDSLANNTITATPSADVRLPKVNVPPFSGDYKDWPSFKDLFTSSIHNREGLSSSQKLQYLKGLLKGDAANLIKHLSITDSNYNEAWGKLTKRYDKKKHIVTSYIKAFINQPSCSQSSATALRRLADTSDEIIRGIKVLGADADKRDPWLIHLILNKTDSETRRAWAEESTAEEFSTFEKFLEFLNTRCDALDTCETAPRKTGHQLVRNLHLDTSLRCPNCNKDHQLFKCPEYKSMDVTARRRFVGSSSLCFNCLNAGHTALNCKSKFRCHCCKQLHHSSLHENGIIKVRESDSLPSKMYEKSANAASTSSNLNPKVPTFNVTTPKSTANHAQVNSYTTFHENLNQVAVLPTALVNILDSSGTLQLCRVLLDSGSQASFISEDCVQRLGLTRQKARITVSGLSSSKTAVTRGAITLSISSRYDQNQHLTVKAYVLDKLTASQPATSFSIPDWNVIRSYQLADPQFYLSRKIDILLGADCFLYILQDGRSTIAPGFPLLQNTIFGYIVSGSLTTSDTKPNILSLHTDISELDCTLRKFWEVEELPVTNQSQLYTTEEEQCEFSYATTHYVDPNSHRYVVRLPFKENSTRLGQSIHTAFNVIKSVERRFQRDPHLQLEYCKFMAEYRDLGHLECIPSQEINMEEDHAYLPHHAVIKPSSTTTKVRVVFNGSATTTSGVSLNDKLLVGPKVQRDLLQILLSFRTFEVAVTADIEKMYRQILVDKRDRDYQRILWRDTATEQMQHLRLKTVTYGTASAPFLATRTLKQLTIDFKDKFPLAESALLNHFYVDDLLGGASNDAEALRLHDELNTLLHQRGFSLRKWASNSQQFLQSIFQHDKEHTSLKIDEYPNTVKVLGLQWIPQFDAFTFHVNLANDHTATKRTILSESSKVFDPLGLIAPVTIRFKILLQQLWLTHHNWDDLIDEELNSKWLKLRNSLHCLQDLRISRWLHLPSESVELHGFSDASERAYSAVVYLRSADETGSVSVNIVAAKTKVAPLKQLSIPRLELCGALLLSRLILFIRSNVNLPDSICFAWTDSQIVLSWLASHPRKWKCFVANRTTEILQILPRSSWQHVKSADNPADLASRGISPPELISSSLWWNGPPWLKNEWKKTTSYTQLAATRENSDTEKRENYLEAFFTEFTNDTLTALFQRYSSLSTIKRIIARCFQFVRILRTSKTEIIEKFVSCDDIISADKSCIRWAQNEAFHQEIRHLKRKQPIPGSSRLLTLTPFLDSSNILRVGGRLVNSNCSYEAKHPPILPKDHIFVKLLVIDMHEKYLHASISLLLSIIRQRYWIISCRTVIKSCINKCLTCVRHRASTSHQLMASLPKNRVSACRAFENIGIDYAGPIELLLRRGRGARTVKGYIVLFVCFSTKALHLEAAGDLTSETFIACLKRFIARRGIPTNIYSDNGTNFVGAKRRLNETHNLFMSLYQTSLINNFLSINRISWHFIPPSAPHFGGIWEAGVKSVKNILRRTIGQTKLTYEELSTLLAQIEGLLNSRPLTPMTDDSSSLNALTPAHLLIGQPLTTLPEIPIEQHSVSILERWRLLQQMHQHFWRRWHVEYLTSLQQRSKWKKSRDDLAVGDLVTIKEDHLPPSTWILGRVTNTHPGHDGLVRVVTLKTARGEIRRPIAKCCKLPVGDS